MEWLRSGLQAAQKQAQETAVRAQALAVQASEQAKAIATPALERAMERAKIIATAAAEEAQLKLQELTRAQASELSTSDELIKYGVTVVLKEYVGSLTYSTFSDYPADSLPSVCPLGPGAQTSSAPGGFQLSPWQERHAMLALQHLPQLQHLRFALIPKRMSEEQFWVIYFTLVKKMLPPEAFGAASVHHSSPDCTQNMPAAASSSTAGGAGAMPAGTGAGARHASTSSAQSRAQKQQEQHISARGSPAGVPLLAPTAVVSPSSSMPTSDADDAELVNALSGSGSDDGGNVGKLDDDPELAAYLQEALGLDDGGDQGSQLGSGAEDLDDYLNQLDAELNEEDLGGEDMEDEVANKED